MKRLQCVWLAGGILLAGLASNAAASVTAWDPQGTSASQPGNGTWESASWSTAQTGQSTPTNWIEGSSALFAVGTGTNYPGFTVTMNGSHTVAGIYNGSLSQGPCVAIIGGSGTLVLPSGLQPFNIASPAAVEIEVPISGASDLILTNTGQLVLTAANTFGATNSVLSNGSVVLANTNGSAMGVSGLIVKPAGELIGFGSMSGTVSNAGLIYPVNGNYSPATLTTGSETWQAGGVYACLINNSTGTAGSGSGWDEIVVNGGLTNLASSANPFVITIYSLNAYNGSGPLATFDNTQDYSWLAVHSTNGPISGFSPATVVVNSAYFYNDPGPNAAFCVTTNNTASGGDLFVNFVHQPNITVSNVTVVQGSNAVFNAVNTVPGSVPATAAYSWKSNGVPMADGGRISGSQTSTLIISNAAPTDAATYFVTASNVAGQMFVAATLTVQPITPVVSWTNPPPVNYGTALTTNQLDATANIGGNFVYTPALGATPNAGTNTLSVVFTPSNSSPSSAVTDTVSMVVYPVPLTVTASNFIRPYNTTNPVFTGSIIGLVNTDNITASYLCGATQSSPVGTYPIVPSLVDPQNRQTNYVVTVNNGALSVGSIISWTNPPAITYGTGIGPGQLNATADIPGVFAYAPPNGTVFSNIGSYNLTVVFTPSNGQYNLATDTVSVAVAPAALTVTASNASRPFGTTNPIFTGSIAGLQNSDNITATYNSSATASSPPGNYSIVPTLVDPNHRATNYSVNLVNGTLAIGAPPAPVAVSPPNIVPLPVTLTTNPGVFVLCPTKTTTSPTPAPMKILCDSASLQTAQFLASALERSTGSEFQIAFSAATNATKGAILITTSNAIASLGAEGYELTVAPDSVVIRAPQQAGTFYGVQSFLQLLPPQIFSRTVVTNTPWVAPCVYAEDYPQYPWRGIMLDVARHFFNKDEVKQLIDAMAVHKLNTLHLHLSDDQGWRLQIMGYPELTPTPTAGVAAGAWRNGIDYGLSPRASTAWDAASGQYGGYYTQNDAREIVGYAAERHITVVPEMELPLHTSSVLAADPQFSCGHSASSYPLDYPSPGINYNADVFSPGTPATMTFFTNTLAQIMSIFPSQYIHCGGDELISLGTSPLKFTSPENDNDWNTYPADTNNMIANGITPGVYVNNNLVPEFVSCAELSANSPVYPTANSCCGDISIVQYQHWLSTTLASFIHGYGRTMMGWTEYEFGGVVPNAGIMDWEPVGAGVFAAQIADAGLPAVLAPGAYCYFNYVEGTGSSSLSVEPPFVVGGSASYLSLSTVYSFNPMPCGLTAPAANNILGAEGTLFTEYVPSFRNVMFKLFPRSAAMAEVLWTPTSSHNYGSFTNRLSTDEQRLSQMGVNYDHETVPQIGAWGPSVPQSPSTETLYFDITTNVTAAGEIDVNFWYTSGSAQLAISSAALLVNNKQVDIDVHAGLAGAASHYNGVAPFIPVYTVYVLHLPELVPGATYSIQAVVSGSGGTNCSGTVYLPNWN